MKLDLYEQGYIFPGTTNYDDGRLPSLPSVTLTAYDFTTSDFDVVKLEHDFIFWEDVVIKQGVTTLVKTTDTVSGDYSMGDKDNSASEDISEILGTTKTVVNGVKITNPAYHSLTLTASGKYAGDAISAREYNQNNGIESIKTSTGNSTLDLTTGYIDGDRKIAINDSTSGKYLIDIGLTDPIPLGEGHSLELWRRNGVWHCEFKQIDKIVDGKITFEVHSSGKTIVGGWDYINGNGTAGISIAISTTENVGGLYSIAGIVLGSKTTTPPSNLDDNINAFGAVSSVLLSPNSSTSFAGFIARSTGTFVAGNYYTYSFNGSKKWTNQTMLG